MQIADSRVKKTFKPFKFSLVHVFIHDAENRIKYGAVAPRFEEIVYVRAGDIKQVIPNSTLKECFGSSYKIPGQVVHGDWPQKGAFNIDEEPLKSLSEHDDETVSWEELWKIRLKVCFEHWVKGLPWEMTDAYRRLEKLIVKKGIYEGCRDLMDISRRYENLDRIFEQVKKEGRLRLKKEADPEYYWPGDSEAIIHVGPGGKLYFGGGSNHRLAIALVLDLVLPAKIGLVHVSALACLEDLRKMSEEAKKVGRPRRDETSGLKDALVDVGIESSMEALQEKGEH